MSTAYDENLRQNLERYLEEYKAKTGRSMRQASLNAVGTAYAIRDIISGRTEQARANVVAQLARELQVSADELLGLPRRDRTGRGGIVLPEISARVGAGGAQTIEEADKVGDWAFPAHEAWRLSPETCYVMQVVGDSAEPRVRDGDRIVVDAGDRDAQSGSLFVLHDGMGLVVKLLEATGRANDEPLVQVISPNPQYPAYERAMSEINVIGRVRGVFRPLS